MRWFKKYNGRPMVKILMQQVIFLDIHTSKIRRPKKIGDRK